MQTKDLQQRLQDCVAAWRAAKDESAKLGDDAAQAMVELIADELLQDSVHRVLRPIFRAAVKGKKKNKKKLEELRAASTLVTSEPVDGNPEGMTRQQS